MAKSLRSKSQRRNRRVKREDDGSVFKATEALRIARLSSKLKQSALKQKVPQDGQGDGDEGFETASDADKQGEAATMQVEGEQAGKSTDETTDAAEKPKVSTSGPRLSAREKYRSQKGFQIRPTPKTVFRAQGETANVSCAGIRQALGECVLKSDCVLRSDPPRSPQDCLKHHADELPEECRHLRTAFFECKRGMLDMRKRFRGTDPGQVQVGDKTLKDDDKRA